MTISQILARSSRSKIPDRESQEPNDTKSHKKSHSHSHSHFQSHKRSSSIKSFLNRFSISHNSKKLYPPVMSPISRDIPSPRTISDPIPITPIQDSPQVSTQVSPQEIPLQFTPIHSHTSIPAITAPSTPPPIEEELRDQILNYEIESFQASISNMEDDSYCNSIIPKELLARKIPNYANDSIFNRASSVISFDDEILSHSTTRNEDIFLNQTERLNYSEFASINDANIQIYKPYSRSKLSLKLVETDDMLQDVDENPAREEPDNGSNNSDSIIDERLNLQPLSESSMLSPSLQTPQREEDDEDIIGFEYNTNEQMYRNEMMLLVERHRLVVSKQQEEINHLKTLLEQERKLHSYYRPQKPSDSFKQNTNETKSPKFRRRFIPMAIELQSDSIRPFNLLPPFDPPARIFGDSKSSSLPPAPRQSLEISPSSVPARNSFSSIIKPTTRQSTNSTGSSRVSVSSTVYHSALEDHLPMDRKLRETPLMPVPERSENRKSSLASSISSIMSTNNNKEFELHEGIDSISNSISSYTIHSNLTTPESLNFQAATFPKFQIEQPSNWRSVQTQTEAS